MLISEFLMDLGTRLSVYRKYHNLTQSQLAEKIGVNKNTIYRMENGESIGSATLAKVLFHFNLQQEVLNAIPDLSQIEDLPKEFTQWK